MEPATRRQLSVHVEGHRNASPPAAGAGVAAPAAEGTGSVAAARAAGEAAAESTAAAGPGEAAAPAPAGVQAERIALEVERIAPEGMWAWKRRQALYGAAR